MKVFISWSGKKSKKLAEVLHDWLPKMFQTVVPFFSADIEKGTLWHTKTRQELNASKIGIICLTETNWDSPWIMFEAGALMNSECSSVVPILFDFPSLKSGSPLQHFQATPFNKDEIRKLIRTINNVLEAPLSEKVCNSTFATWWPVLNRGVNAVLKEVTPRQEMEDRTDKSILIEILELNRSVFYNSNPHKELMTNPILLSPIDDLEITTKTANILKSENTFYIGDLIQRTGIELLKIPSINEDILFEINQMLARKGLFLGMQLENWPPENLLGS